MPSFISSTDHRTSSCIPSGALGSSLGIHHARSYSTGWNIPILRNFSISLILSVPANAITRESVNVTSEKESLVGKSSRI